MRKGNVHRFQGCLLPYTNKLTVQEIPAFSRLGSIIPIQSSTIWSVHCSSAIYSGSQGSQTGVSKQGYMNPPVARPLVGQSLILTNLSPAYPDLSSSMSRIGLGSKHGEIRTGTQRDLRIHRLPVSPQRGGLANRSLIWCPYCPSSH